MKAPLSHRVPLQAPDPSVRADLTRLLTSLNREGVREFSVSRSLPSQPIYDRGLTDWVRINGARRRSTAIDAWYAAGHLTAGGYVTVTPSPNWLYALPVSMAHPFRIEELGFYVHAAGAAGSEATVGVYDSWYEKEGIPYPKTQLYETAALACTSTGLKSQACSIDLEGGKLYWLVFHGGSGAMPTLRGIAPTDMNVLQGWDVNFNYNLFGWQVAHTYPGTTGDKAMFPDAAGYTTSADDALVIAYRLGDGYALPLNSQVTLWNAPRDGYYVRRVTLDSPKQLTKAETYSIITPGIREGDTFTELGTFDTRDQDLKPGVPWVFGDSDLAHEVSANQILEVRVERVGWPVHDLSECRVQYDLLYAGD